MSNKILKYCFMIDSTGSMQNSINAAYEQVINMASDSKRVSGLDVEVAAICYRDPVDSPKDVHEYHDFTSNIDDIKHFLSKQKAMGGRDRPEDWVGAFNILLEKLNWGNDNNVKCLTIIADAPPHGKTFCPFDKYPEEGPKLIQQIKSLAERNITVKLIAINSEPVHSMNIFSEFYKNFGGQICDVSVINLYEVPERSKVEFIGHSIRKHSETLSLLASQQ